MHWGWLQTLRGLAAFLVLIIHSWLLFKEQLNFSSTVLDFFILGIVDIGKIGVVIFFLISGFLLPYSMKKKKISDFVKNRFFRLYPTYWFSILLALIFVGGYSFEQVIGNISMFQTFLFVDDMIGAFWTMPIELVLYVFCIVFVRYLYNSKFIFLSYILILLATLAGAFVRFNMEVKVPLALPLLLAISILGYVIRLYNEKEIQLQMLIKYVSIFVVFLVPITLFAYDIDFGSKSTWYRYFNSYILAIAIFLLLLNGDLSNRFFSYIGKISYSLYLTHGVVIAAFPKIISLLEYSYIAVLVFNVLVFLTAIITYHLVEVPSFYLYSNFRKHRL
jgi:peptidoglycan/LPS O-acetylase OafA/YrhL